jgi:Uma2 family endonuclease
MATVEQLQLMTIDEYAKLPDTGRPTELVRGRVVEMNVPQSRHAVVCGNAFAIIRSFVKQHGLGRVLSNDGGIITERDPDTLRGAEVSYFSYSRLPHGQTGLGYFPVPPELVIEVRSPGDRWPRVLQKVAEYLNARVDVVCVVDFLAQTVRVYDSEGPERTLQAGDELTLPTILPGFRAPVEEFFED